MFCLPHCLPSLSPSLHWDIWLTRNAYTIEPDMSGEGDDGEKKVHIVTRDKRKPSDDELLEQMQG